MPETLSAKRFEEFVELWSERQSDVDKRFDRLDDRLETIEHRLDRIEEILWQGQKVDQLEHRFRELAERSGFPDLAQPLRPPLGQA
jgi:predicted nuclease with TOPRIM domain